MRMRKTLAIIFAIAILGTAAIAAQKDGQNGSTATASPGSQTSGATSPSASSNSNGSKFKDGKYTGSTADTPYGPVKVAVVISGGKISDIEFIKMPNDQPHSREVTAMSEPLMKQDTLDRQSADIDFVSGATSTVYGYQESLQKALDQAKIS
jgi:uncharacterized protein with FMN-binding domain